MVASIAFATLVILAPSQGVEGQTPGTARGTSDAVDEVWAQEDAYWRFVKAGDVEKCLSRCGDRVLSHADDL